MFEYSNEWEWEDEFEDILDNPKDYYFQACLNTGSVINDYFVITPKDYFDNTGCLLDVDILGIDYLLNSNGFEYLTDSTYEYVKGTMQQGTQALLNLGLTQKKMI